MKYAPEFWLLAKIIFEMTVEPNGPGKHSTQKALTLQARPIGDRVNYDDLRLGQLNAFVVNLVLQSGPVSAN